MRDAPAGGDGPDDDLGRRLERALHEGLTSGEVDGPRLVGGARAGARRIRRRRAVAVGVAAVLAVAVPVGVVGITGSLGRGDGAAQVASGVATGDDEEPDARTLAEPTTEPTTVPTPTAVAPEAPVVDSSTLGPDENAVDIPGAVGLTPADLPVPTELLSDTHYRLVPVVNGQECGTLAGGPIAGYYQGFAEENSNDLQQLAVYVTVTAWSRGGGPQAFADVRDDTGECRFSRPLDPVAWTPGVGQEGFTGSGFLEANEAGTAVLRVGDLLVGVQTSGAAEAYDYVALSSQLAEVVGVRVVEQLVPGSGAA